MRDKFYYFYKNKAKTYKKEDNEANMRYLRAISLADITPGVKVLDVGCKDGRLKDILNELELNVSYFGMDISEDNIKNIRNYNPDHFKIGDACKNIPFNDNMFDFVFALELIEHVKFPTSLLESIYRVLTKDGKLILSVPNPYCFIELYSNIFHKPDTEGHIYSFTHQTIQRLLDFYNFKINKQCGTYMRIPFSSHFSKKKQYRIITCNNILLTRSYIYMCEKKC